MGEAQTPRIADMSDIELENKLRDPDLPVGDEVAIAAELSRRFSVQLLGDRSTNAAAEPSESRGGPPSGTVGAARSPLPAESPPPGPGAPLTSHNRPRQPSVQPPLRPAPPAALSPPVSSPPPTSTPAQLPLARPDWPPASPPNGPRQPSYVQPPSWAPRRPPGELRPFEASSSSPRRSSVPRILAGLFIGAFTGFLAVTLTVAASASPSGQLDSGPAVPLSIGTAVWVVTAVLIGRKR